MTLIARAVLETTGFAGAPGINVLHFTEGTAAGGAFSQAVVDDLYGELDSIAAAIKNIGAPGTSRMWLPELSILDVATGQLVDAKTPTDGVTPHSTPGNEPGDLPRATAALLQLQSDRFLNGRRLKGRMFVGPLSGSMLDPQGLCSSTCKAVIQDAFVAVTSGVGARLAVYSRPVKNGRAGTWGDVIAVGVRSTPSYLRSRSV